MHKMQLQEKWLMTIMKVLENKFEISEEELQNSELKFLVIRHNAVLHEKMEKWKNRHGDRPMFRSVQAKPLKQNC